MKLFGQVIRTVVNVVVLPVVVVRDVVMSPIDIADGDLLKKTAEQLQKIKDEARD